MALDARVGNFFLTYGVTDRLDFTALIPVVSAALSGFSDATIVIGPGEDPAAGFSFGGPTEDPKLQERSVVPRARATGLGDISLRGKLRLNGTEDPLGFAVLADVRLPTGDEGDFLGSPGTSVHGIGIMSLEAGAGFTPHANAGMVLRTGKGQRNTVVAALGFDHRSSSRLTIAAEFLSQIPLGDNPLVLEKSVIRDGLGNDTVVPNSNLPTLRDNQFDGALGFKYRLWNLALLVNAIVPLNDGGLRSDVLWTVGLQGSF
jgi:hypothetical protein